MKQFLKRNGGGKDFTTDFFLVEYEEKNREFNIE